MITHCLFGLKILAGLWILGACFMMSKIHLITLNGTLGNRHRSQYKSMFSVWFEIEYNHKLCVYKVKKIVGFRLNYTCYHLDLFEIQNANK